MIRINNRWCGPLMADFGPPLGRVRIPKAGAELDVDFNDLQLPRRTQAMVDRRTLEIVDMSLPEADAPAQTPANDGSGEDTAAGGPGEGTNPPVGDPKADPKPAMPQDRIDELRELAAGDARSPTVRKARELLEEAGVPLVAPKE